MSTKRDYKPKPWTPPLVRLTRLERIVHALGVVLMMVIFAVALLGYGLPPMEVMP